MFRNNCAGKIEEEKNGEIKRAPTKKIIPLAVIGVVLLATLILVFNIHTCEECDEVYFGKQYEISFLGETEKVCKDCHEDFYDLSSWF